MRRFRIVTLCVLGACALGAFAAGSASAALPELGRCVKVSTPKTGEYASANCVSVNLKHKGEYEWVAGAGASKSFKQTLAGPQIETVTGIVIGCTDIQLTGELTGTKTEKVTKVLGQGCQDLGPRFNCYSNPAAPGTIESEVPLTGEIGFIEGSRNETNPWVGLDLKGENSSLPMLTFTCGEGGGMLAITIEGSVIGHLTKTNVMSTSFGVTYKEKEGIQSPTSFKGGPEDVLKEITRPIGPGTKEEQAAIASPSSAVPGEALEVKAKV